MTLLHTSQHTTLPHWAREAKITYSTINARADTVEQKPAFRTSFRRRRCLDSCDGWFEWQQLESGKQPWWIHMVDEQDFAFAGLWDRWEGPGKVIESCTIIVTEANEAVGEIHDRMPVILEPTDYGHWLDPTVNDVSVLKPLLRPWRHENLSLYKVSRDVNQARNDDRSLIIPA